MFRSARNRLRPVWITLFGIVLRVFQHENRFRCKFFDIVQFSRSCAPQPCGWRLDYFTTEVVFCQALFSRLLNVLNLDHSQHLSVSWCFWTSIGSFQRLRAEASEVILLSQRLALKYNTTPPAFCQHFLTSFFYVFCKPFRCAEIVLIWMPSVSRWTSSEAASFIFAACPERSFHPLGRDDRQPLRAGTRFSYIM